MYQQYFGLSEAPFSIAPDPRYLFLSNKHREALAHLIYGVGDQGGFVLLSGEVGTGKTTICRCLLQQVPDNADIAYIVNPRQSVNQLLQSIFNDLGVAFTDGITSKELIDQLNQYLLDAHARGRNTIVIIDEAQNLSTDVLEQLRLLTNLETNEKKLLQLVLLGQPELNALLSRPQLRQLAQRITARYHLSALSRREVSDYIGHRLSVAGCRANLFSPGAVRKIYWFSQGIPRLINLICDRALLGVYASNGEQVTAAIVSKAAKEVFNQTATQKPLRRWTPLIAAVCVGFLMFTVTYLWKNGLIGSNSNERLLSDLERQVQQHPPEAIVHTINSTEPSRAHPVSWQRQLEYNDDPASALMALYQLWQLSPGEANVKSCLNTTGDTRAVYCRKAISTVSQLRAYNSPAVLSYKLEGNRFGYLLVKQIKDNTVTVKIGEQLFSLPIEDLFNERFSHSYLLTRIPGEIDLPIFPGDSGPAIRWLQARIAGYNPDSPVMQGVAIVDEDIASGNSKLDFLYAHHLDFNTVLISDSYDDMLQKHIVQLQKNLGMVGNAIVDIQLLVALNKSAYASDPRLYPLTQYNGFESSAEHHESTELSKLDTTP